MGDAVGGAGQRTVEHGGGQQASTTRDRTTVVVPDGSAARAAWESADDSSDVYQTFLSAATDGDLVARVREQFGAWMRQRKNWDASTDESGFFRGPSGQELLVLHRESSSGHDFRARLRETYPKTGSWTTTLTVHDGPGDRDWVGLRVSNDQGRVPDAPALAKYLIDAIELRDGDTWLSSAPRTITTSTVESFAHEVTSFDRQGLVFVASTGYDGEPIPGFRDLVQRWTRTTAGLAQVAILDPAATGVFNQIMGPRHGVPTWTIRTFLPDVDPAIEADGRRHRILGAHRLGSEKEPHIRGLFGRIARRHAADQARPTIFVQVDQALNRHENKLLVDDLTGTDERVGRHASPSPAVPAPRVPVSPDSPPEDRTPTTGVDASVPTEKSLPDVAPEVERYLEQIEQVTAITGISDLSPASLDDLGRLAALGLRHADAAERLARQMEERLRENEELKAELERYKDVNLGHETELADAQEDIFAKDDEIRRLRGRLRTLGDHDTANSGPTAIEVLDCPRDFSELADRLEQESTPHVAFTGDLKCVRALDDHDPFGRLAKVAWRAILALSDYVRAGVDGVSTRGLKDYLENTPDGYREFEPNKFGETESGSTMNAYGDERRFPVPTDVDPSGFAVMKPHVKLGRVGIVSPRMHLLDDWRGTGMVYVGFIGTHRRNTQTN